MQSDITVWHTISGKNFDLTFDQKVEADVHAEGTLIVHQPPSRDKLKMTESIFN